MAVEFNDIPANLRVPLFYAEINAGQSPYQGQSRLLVIGQKTTGGGTIRPNTIALLNANEQRLAGRGSHLAEAALWARQNNPFGEIWIGALADPNMVAATGTLTFTGNAAQGETVTIGEKTYKFTANVNGPRQVLLGGTPAASISNLIAAINGGEGRGTLYGGSTGVNEGVTAAVGTGTSIVLTAIDAGEPGNAIITTSDIENANFAGGTLSGGFSGTPASYVVEIKEGIEGKSGTIAIYICGEKVQVGVGPTDTKEAIASRLLTAVNKGYVRFGRNLAHCVVASTPLDENDDPLPDQVLLTARNAGELGNNIAIDIDLYKETKGEDGPLQVYLSVAKGVDGAGTPSLAALLGNTGDIEFDWICAPYADTTTLDAIKDYLAARWGSMEQIYGHYISAKFAFLNQLNSFGSGRNDPNVSIMGVAQSPSPPWRWAGAVGGVVARDKNIGGEVDQAYRLSQPLQYLPLVGIMAPKNRRQQWDTQQRNQLYQNGISGYRVAVDGTVQLDRVITTYQLNPLGQPDISWLSVETRAQMMYFARYMRQRITQIYGRKALASDGAEDRPGIVTPRMIKAECVHAYREMERGGLVEKSDLFAASLVVERSSDPNRVNAYLPVDVVNQFNIFAANITSFLEYPA